MVRFARRLRAAVVLLVALIAAPAALAQSPSLRFDNLDGAPFPDRLVMSRIGTLASPPTANGVHDVSKVRLHNDGTAPLTVSSLTLSGPFQFVTPPSVPLTVAAGASTDLSVRFVAETGSLQSGTRGFHSGTLTVGSDDPAAPSAVVTLRGYWQNFSENNREPKLVELIEQLFGYETEILLAGQVINSQGRVERVGDEVVSPYWRLADTSQPVTVRQLAAYHGCCTDAAPLYWHERGTTATSLIVRHNATDGQTVLPRRAGSAVALTSGTFAPGAGIVFGFRVAGDEWSDSFRNATTNDDCSSGAGTCGQHLRFWPAKDPSGAVIPNTYVMGMDYAGINYDFNDNVYLISNVVPAEAVTTTGTVRLNAGGLDVTTGGVAYGANQFATNGQSYTPTCDLGDIAGTTDDDLYRTEYEPVATGPRTFAYNVPVPNGPYTVRMHFAEIYFGSCGAPAAGVGKRVFSVTMEGQPVLTNLDIFAEAGVRAALVKTFQTTVSGNMLNLGFLASANNPMLSAIEIVPGVTDLPPTTPAALVATGSTGGVALDWADNTEPDLAGYTVHRSSISGGPYVALTATPVTTSAFSDATLQAGERGFYVVRAVDVAGNTSGPSAQVHATRQVPATTFTAVNWGTATSQPLGNSEGQSAVVGGKLYSFGGFDVEKKNGTCNCFTPTPRAYVYDPDAGTGGTWSAIAPLPHTNGGGVTHAGITTDGVNIFIAGGSIANTARTGQIYGTTQVWRYNVAGDTYTALPALPTDRAGGQLAYDGGKLYYIGGFNKARTLDVGTVYVLDYAAFLAGQTVIWTTAAALPNPRHHMGGVVLNHLIYIVGGQHGHDDALVTQSSVHAYDPASNTWTAVADLPQALSHISSATYVHEGRIIVLGGERQHTSYVNTAYAYTPSTNAWASLTPLPIDRSSAVGGSLGGSLYLSTGNFTRPTYRGTPGTPNQPPIASFTATPDGASPLTIHFNAADSSDPDGTIASYTWAFGDGTPDGVGGPTIDHAYATAGTYTVVLTVTDNSGATATATQTLSVLGSASRPSVTGTSPADGATGVLRDAFVAVDVSLPNVGNGIDGSTLTAATVRLYPTGDPAAAVSAQLNTSGGGDAIVLQPTTLLAANTAYTFEVTEGLRDLAGQPFLAYTMSFTTGSLPIGTAPSAIQFARVPLSGATPSVVGQHSSLAFGPDGRLYATTIDGRIKRWDVATDGSLSNLATFSIIKTMNGGSNRLLIGLAFDPASTAADPILWVTHSTFGFNNVPDWGGKLTRVSGPTLATGQDYLVNLPRSIRDHATNSLAFGPDGALYLLQGSNSAMGEADAAWGNRPERLLTAAVLRVDVAALTAAGSLPLDVKTSEGGTYDPFAAEAPVRIFASGVRNAYDLVWHTNGDLYVPTNGSAANGRAPASVEGTLRPDGLPYNGPAIPAIDAVETQNDYLFRVAPPSGGTWAHRYFGHPNPTRGEYVLNGGNPTAGQDLAQVNAYPVGVLPDAAWGGFAYNFGRNISPNGVLEYRSGTFEGALQGKLLVVRYSGGDDIVVLTLDASRDIAPDGDAVLFIQGSELLSDPLDLVENPATGDLYVSEYGGGGQILLLRPTGNAPPVASFTATPDPADPFSVAFDASASTDDVGIVSYAWTFGDSTSGTGQTTSHAYAGSGTYTVILTVTDGDGATGTTQQTIAVGTAGDGPFAESGGLVVMEAENAHESVARGGQAWETAPATGVVGTALGALPNTGVNRNAGFAGTAPELRYRVVFDTPGTYYVWGRVLASSDNDDSFHTGIDGVGPASSDRIFTTVRSGPVWTSQTMDQNSRPTFTVPTAGEHVISVWMREDGLVLDRLLLTADPAFTPSGNGPAESARSTGNEPPVAAFTATPDGEGPLAYTFDASGSTDDGTITAYAWAFGDGATGTGPTPAHTYPGSGTYTVVLTVTDDGGATGTAQQSLTVDDGSLVAVAEAGTATVSQTGPAQWHPVSLQNAFVDPVVVMAPPSSTDPEPLTVRVRNVTASGFEFQLDEWDYLDGVHGTETVPYLVVERGVHTLADGRLVEAGTVSARGAMQTVTLTAPFAEPPVVLDQVVTATAPEAVSARLRNVGSTSFQVKLQGQESTSGFGWETLAYIAIAPGTTAGKLDVDRTTDRVTDASAGLTFGAPFAAPPVVVASMQTLNGSDPATLRSQLVSATGLQVRVEEEASADAETTHGTEVVGYVALPEGPLYSISAPENPAPVAAFTATPDGEGPLAYTFDASGSTDDGTITAYAWAFGDGATGTGPTPAHTYPGSGTYTVVLTVTDDGGATGTAQQSLTVDDGSLVAVAEAGTATVSQTGPAQWHPVSLQNAFVDPVVVMAPPSSTDPEPLTVRVRNVTASGFEFQLDEWDYLDGVHGTETVPYLVVERGVHTLADGRLVEAGTVSARGAMQTVTLTAPFAEPPVVLDQVVTATAPEAVSARLRNVGSTSFQVKLQGQESTSGFGWETLAYIAIAPGTTAGKLDVDRTTDRVTDASAGLTFGAPFAAPPVVVASMQTLNGSDPATLRSQLVSATGLQVRVEEEASADAETTHGTEVVGYVALPSGALYAFPAPLTAMAATPGLLTVALPTEYALEPNRPNPFRGRTTLRYALPEDASVRLTVYDALGRRVAIVVDEAQTAGWHEAPFDASGLAAGVYVGHLEAGSFAQSARMLLVR